MNRVHTFSSNTVVIRGLNIDFNQSSHKSGRAALVSVQPILLSLDSKNVCFFWQTI